MTHTESTEDETPRKPLAWERIETAAPCKSTDSPAELVLDHAATLGADGSPKPFASERRLVR